MTSERTDLYAVLGLTRHATQDQIAHAYRVLLRRHHPDTREPGSHAEASDAALQQVLAAYAVLGDPDRRAGYDARLPRPAPRPVLRSAPPRVRRAAPAVQPPIQAGPVRWHAGPYAAFED